MDSLALLTSSPSFLLRYFFFNLQTFLCCHFLSTWNQGRDRHQPEAQEALELLRVLCPRFTASFRIMLLATNGVWTKWHLWEVLFGTNEISCKAEAGSSKGQVEWSFVAEQRKVTIVILSRLDPKLFPKIYIFYYYTFVRSIENPSHISCFSLLLNWLQNLLFLLLFLVCYQSETLKLWPVIRNCYEFWQHTIAMFLNWFKCSSVVF